MASQPVMEAVARESRANAREDMAVLTSGARAKVDSAMASMQAFGQTVLHPTDKTKKEEAQVAAEQQKKEAKEKRDEIRSIAAQQAESERAAARSMVAKGVSEAGGARYPVLITNQPQQAAATQQISDPNFQAQHPPTSSQQALGPTYQTQQATATPHTLDPNYHPIHPPVSNTPLNGRASAYTPQGISPSAVAYTQGISPSGTAAPLEAIRVERPQDQRPVVGGADTSTQAPVTVPPPSRSGGHVRQGEKVEEGVEDADFYPPTRVVQT